MTYALRVRHLRRRLPASQQFSEPCVHDGFGTVPHFPGVFVVRADLRHGMEHPVEHVPPPVLPSKSAKSFGTTASPTTPSSFPAHLHVRVTAVPGQRPLGVFPRDAANRTTRPRRASNAILGERRSGPPLVDPSKRATCRVVGVRSRRDALRSAEGDEATHVWMRHGVFRRRGGFGVSRGVYRKRSQRTSLSAPPMYARREPTSAECATRSTAVAPGLAASAARTVASTRSRYQVYPGSVVPSPRQKPRLNTARRILAQSLRSRSTTCTSHPRARREATSETSGSPKGLT